MPPTAANVQSAGTTDAGRTIGEGNSRLRPGSMAILATHSSASASSSGKGSWPWCWASQADHSAYAK